MEFGQGSWRIEVRTKILDKLKRIDGSRADDKVGCIKDNFLESNDNE